VEGSATFQHRGNGPAVLLDGGSSGPGVYFVNFGTGGNLFVEGRSGSQDAVFTRSIHRSFVKARVTGAGPSYAALRTAWCVLTEFDVAASAVFRAFVSRPHVGIAAGARSPTEPSAACIFHNPYIFGVSGTGFEIDGCQKSTFLGGSAEHCAVGLTAAPGTYSSGNLFIGLDMEGNAQADAVVGCWDSEFQHCFSSGLIRVEPQAIRCRFRGGVLNSLENHGQQTLLDALTLGAAGGVFTDHGAGTVVGTHVFTGNH
jgi:hypothetical protein